MDIATDSITEQLIAQLRHIEGKAEIVDGRIERMSPTGRRPARASGAIYRSLCAHEKSGQGWAYPDNVAFLVDLPNRKSFSPDAAFSLEEPEMEFGKCSPVFAVEVRSAKDYGPAAEREIATKRADYFAAGTKVVWDVDLLSEEVIRVFRAESPSKPTIYRRNEMAEAEPAVPGWTFPVNDLFE